MFAGKELWSCLFFSQTVVSGLGDVYFSICTQDVFDQGNIRPGLELYLNFKKLYVYVYMYSRFFFASSLFFLELRFGPTYSS